MKVFITSQWQTRGIFEDDADQAFSNYPSMLKSNTCYKYYGPGQWHLTLEDAKIQAERLRLNNIKSLTKRLEKLNNLSFV